MKATNPAQARLGAETAAQMDAFRNLLAQAKGIQITAGKHRRRRDRRDEIRGKVEGVIRGFKVTAKRYFSDGGVEIDVEVPLSALTDLRRDRSERRSPVKTDGEQEEHRPGGRRVRARREARAPPPAPRRDRQGALRRRGALSVEARKASRVSPRT